ncbi:hypothetical protein [Hyalangium sp.]|uniref:DUF7948 domain-containing protein n=1 Tax=Hyalangium sp. TaxID=2028555 RepID=UPI002D2F075F|nr:hypothetical protein [Hyalangium sp.]HYH98295.1 hypothetical protein [Hyalangium sp.]
MIVPVPGAPGHYVQQQQRAHTIFTDLGLTLQLTPPTGPTRELHWGVARAQAVLPQPLDPQEARLNMLVGPRVNWKTNLPTWGALYYPAVAPGVDLWFEAREGGVQYSLRAEQGADLRQVRLEWRGAQELRIAGNGRALEVKLADGELREEGLHCGQEAADGTSREVPCRYREVSLKGTNLWEYVIEVEVDEPGRPAWVDPTIQWNTFVGAQGNDALENITVILGAAIAGQFFFVGSSGSDVQAPIDPTPPGDNLHVPSARSDVVVSRRNADGTVLWTSLIGGTGDDFGRAFAIGAIGDVFVAGTTTSTNLPPGPQGATHSGGRDGFIARISSGGDTLHWIQYIGGPGDEEIYSLTRGQDGKLYAAGSTTSSQLSASDAGPSRGRRDFFVSRIDAFTGAVERNMVRSGSLDEEAVSIVAGEPPGSGALLYVTGYTESPDFPLGIAPRTANSQTDGGREAVVLKLNEQLGTPVWGTFIGAASGADDGRGVMYVPETQRVMVVGTTHGPDFPNSSPSGSAPQGANAFLAAFEPATGDRTFSTLVGGSGDDEGLALTTGSFRSIYIGGKTTSTNLPVPFGFDSRANGTEGFVIRLAPDMTLDGGFVPEWGTYVGGSQEDEVRALGAGPNNEVLLIGGMTRSSDMLPHQLRTVDAPYRGNEEMFLISLNAQDLTPPLGLVRDGISGDTDIETNTQAVVANWQFVDREKAITNYEFGLGTVPECADIVPFHSVDLAASISRSTAQLEIPPLEPGRWYFATVIARNELGLSNKVSSDGYFLLLPNGGPNPIPLAPALGTPCPGETPDGGLPDGGDGGADAGPKPDPDGGNGQNDGGSGQEPPLGWPCGCDTTSGPTGLLLLVLLALGLRVARRAS